MAPRQVLDTLGRHFQRYTEDEKHNQVESVCWIKVSNQGRRPHRGAPLVSFPRVIPGYEIKSSCAYLDQFAFPWYQVQAIGMHKGLWIVHVDVSRPPQDPYTPDVSRVHKPFQHVDEMLGEHYDSVHPETPIHYWSAPDMMDPKNGGLIRHMRITDTKSLEHPIGFKIARGHITSLVFDLDVGWIASSWMKKGSLLVRETVVQNKILDMAFSAHNRHE